MMDLETAFYAGIGMALKGKEKVEAAAKKLVKDSKMEAKAGKAFVAKTVKHAEDAKKELKKQIDDSVKTTINKMGFISKKEADQLKAEIKRLQAQLNKPAKKAAKKK